MENVNGTTIRTTSDKVLIALGLLAIGFFFVLGTLLVLQIGGDLSTAERYFFGPSWIVAAVVMALGLYVSDHAPWIGAGIMAIAAIAMSLLMFWAFFITVPIGILLIVLAVMRARRLSRVNAA